MRLFPHPTGKKLWAAIATVILGTTLTTVAVTQQSASAANLNDCTNFARVVCIYEHPNYTGQIARYDFTRQNGHIVLPSWMRNRPSSVYINYSNKWVSVSLYDTYTVSPEGTVKCGGRTGPVTSNLSARDYYRIPALARTSPRFDEIASCIRIDY
jgi:hypothetical protein